MECPSAKRLLGSTPWRPRRPMLVLALSRAEGSRPRAGVSRTLRGTPLISIAAPASWAARPPGLEELAALLCCARDRWLYDVLSNLLGSLAASLAIALAGPLSSSGLLGAVEVSSSLLALAGFFYLVRSLADRGLDECVRAARLGAGVTGSTIYYQQLARLVLYILETAGSCKLPRCEVVRATPLGAYRIRVSRRAGRIHFYTIQARPTQ